MTRTISRLALAALLAAPAAVFAQTTPTPEGTTITNTATASWTDANGNTYTPVTASASVKVGYLVGVDVVSAASATPASPSATNYQSFTINNIGNGTDSVTVAATVGSGASITGYRYNGTVYATLAALNTALSGVAINMSANIVVDVQYTVSAGQGGQTIALTLTATSRRSPAAPTGSDASTTNLQPAVSASVATTPDAGTIDKVPSNGTQYSQTFTVTNNGNASDTFTLLGSTSSGTSATLAIVSVNGVAGASASATIASGASSVITVVYTLANVAAGTTDSLRLKATSGNTASAFDYGAVQIRAIRAALAMTKVAYMDDQSTTINSTTDRVLPGQFIQYKITITNGGLAPASTVSVSDPIATQLTYNTATGDAAGWTFTNSSGTITAALSGSLAAGASRYFWVRVQVK